MRSLDECFLVKLRVGRLKSMVGEELPEGERTSSEELELDLLDLAGKEEGSRLGGDCRPKSSPRPKILAGMA